MRLESPGPSIYSQRRIGFDKKPFLLQKLRSMVACADQVGPHLSVRGDPRITHIGRLLRRTKLDELPQLWNVLKGEMSLVGPRPEVPRYVEHYKPEWSRVFSVRPGITDLATLQFREEEWVLEHARDREQAYLEVVLPIKMDLALQYVDNRSPIFDFRILVKTVWSITLGRFLARPDDSLARRAIAQIEELNKKL